MNNRIINDIANFIFIEYKPQNVDFLLLPVPIPHSRTRLPKKLRILIPTVR